MKDGYEYRLLHAKFYLGKLTLPARRSGMAENRTRQFVDKLEREGWAILGSPLVVRPKVISESSIAPNRFARDGGLWHPRQLWLDGTIPAGHPWVHPSEDLFFISVPVKRPAQVVTLEVSDETIKELQARNDPVLEKMVVH
jgi:hypothetical protein